MKGLESMFGCEKDGRHAFMYRGSVLVVIGTVILLHHFNLVKWEYLVLATALGLIGAGIYKLVKAFKMPQ